MVYFRYLKDIFLYDLDYCIDHTDAFRDADWLCVATNPIEQGDSRKGELVELFKVGRRRMRPRDDISRVD